MNTVAQNIKRFREYKNLTHSGLCDTTAKYFTIAVPEY